MRESRPLADLRRSPKIFFQTWSETLIERSRQRPPGWGHLANRGRTWGWSATPDTRHAQPARHARTITKAEGGSVCVMHSTPPQPPVGPLSAPAITTATACHSSAPERTSITTSAQVRPKRPGSFRMVRPHRFIMNQSQAHRWWGLSASWAVSLRSTQFEPVNGSGFLSIRYPFRSGSLVLLPFRAGV